MFNKINTPNKPENKPRFRFRQNMLTGIVECLDIPIPCKYPSTDKHKPDFNYKVVSFPNYPGHCPKCLGRGVVTGQATNKLIGVCFWCDGKGSISDADIANAKRRVRMGLTLDCRKSS